MNRLFTTLLVLMFSALLAACGFQLRGVGSAPARSFPFTHLYIDSKSPVALQLAEAMKSYPNVTVVDSAKDADGVLRIVDEKRNRDLSAINRAGQANEYQFSYIVTAQLWINGRQVGNDIVQTQSRTMTYNSSQVLGKDQEEALLWTDMLRGVARTMIYRLSNEEILRDGLAASRVVPDTSTKNAISKP